VDGLPAEAAPPPIGAGDEGRESDVRDIPSGGRDGDGVAHAGAAAEPVAEAVGVVDAGRVPPGATIWEATESVATRRVVAAGVADDLVPAEPCLGGGVAVVGLRLVDGGEAALVVARGLEDAAGASAALGGLGIDGDAPGSPADDAPLPLEGTDTGCFFAAARASKVARSFSAISLASVAALVAALVAPLAA